MSRAAWGERGAGADPYHGMTDDEITEALEAKWRLGIALAGGSAIPAVEREELLGTSAEYTRAIKRPWELDEADERFTG